MIKPEISVIYGYRNRDTDRVKRCMESLKSQSFQDFEVVFIDYGSDQKYSSEIKKLIDNYSFARYYYNNTFGMPWNRAHALNSGVKLSTGNYILFGDVDLIYSQNVLEALISNASEHCHVFNIVYWLNRNYNNWNNLNTIDLNKFSKSNKSGKGGVHLIKKSIIEDIGGYDEFYCFWGVEDRDLYHRLSQTNIKDEWIDSDKYPVFHQWHEIVSDQKKGFFPEKWWDDMNIHFQLNFKNIKRNSDGWGKLLSNEDRPVFNTKQIPFEFAYTGDSYYKAKVISKLISEIHNLNSDECIRVDIHKSCSTLKIFENINKDNNTFKNLFTKIIFYCGSYFNREKYFNPRKDLIYIIWKLIKTTNLVKDYSITEEKDKLIICIK